MRKLDRERAQTNGQDIRYTPDSPPRLSLWPLAIFVLMKILVGTIAMKKFFIGFLTREDMAPGCWPLTWRGGEVAAVDITVEDIQSTVNDTADEENK